MPAWCFRRRAQITNIGKELPSWFYSYIFSSTKEKIPKTIIILPRILETHAPGQTILVVILLEVLEKIIAKISTGYFPMQIQFVGVCVGNMYDGQKDMYLVLQTFSAIRPGAIYTCKVWHRVKLLTGPKQTVQLNWLRIDQNSRTVWLNQILMSGINNGHLTVKSWCWAIFLFIAISLFVLHLASSVRRRFHMLIIRKMLHSSQIYLL